MANASQRDKHLSLCPAQEMLNGTALPVSCHGRGPGLSSPSSAGEQGFSEHPWEKCMSTRETWQQLGQVVGLGSFLHPHIANLAAAEP